MCYCFHSNVWANTVNFFFLQAIMIIISNKFWKWPNRRAILYFSFLTVEYLIVLHFIVCFFIIIIIWGYMKSPVHQFYKASTHKSNVSGCFQSVWRHVLRMFVSWKYFVEWKYVEIDYILFRSFKLMILAHVEEKKIFFFF